jgi:hypothetical protein
MDPNANTRERIALLEAGEHTGWTAEEASRFVELSRAYSEWTAAGGFSADRDLLDRLAEMRAKQF